MMRRKEMKQLLEERMERIGLLEQRLETLERLLDGYRAREQAIVEALSNANETARQRVGAAEAEAQRLKAEAEERAGKLVAEAETRAAAVRDAAEQESAALLEKTQRSVRAYEDALAAYNANLERSAAEVQASAARYAAFIQERKLDAGELFNEVGGGALTANAAVADELPDPDGDPKTLMQNIYKLQNRDIPAEAIQPAQQAADAPPDGLFDEIVADLGPRPVEPEPAAEP
ncbi:MAG: hypothetical protein Q4C13_04760, partial [Clostridia bacterium]|nr:hypothetical protein [Clostridia bacterium]